jgi:hypothetical protein
VITPTAIIPVRPPDRRQHRRNPEKGEAPVNLPHRWSARAREKLAVALLTTFLLGWIAVSLAVTAGQIHQAGYGSGITNRAHLPEQIKTRYNLPDATTPHEVMEATSR